MLEDQVSEKFVEKFSQWFDVDDQIWSDCRTARVDYFMTHKESGWKCIIELKSSEYKKGDDLGDVIIQGFHYSVCTFNGQHYPVFIYPALSSNYLVFNQEEKDGWVKDRHDKNNTHHAVNSMLARFRVGEVRNLVNWRGEKRYEFVFNQNTVFSTVTGKVNQDKVLVVNKLLSKWWEKSRISGIIGRH